MFVAGHDEERIDDLERDLVPDRRVPDRVAVEDGGRHHLCRLFRGERYRCAVARASGSEDATRGVEFALDSFELADGRLVVAGRWYGVTGRRFVRPVLKAPGQRRLVALLDHKPWSAEEGAPWLAAFPDGGYAGPSRLQVAPDIAVELPAAGPGAGDGAPRPARLTRPPVERSMADAEPTPAREPAPPQRTRKVERDPAQAEIEALRGQHDEARAVADRLRSELDQARQESERLQGELTHAQTDADRLRTELSHVRAEANTLRRHNEETQAKAEQLEAQVSGLRTDAQRAVSERSVAQAEVRRPPTGPYITPRPMAFRDPEPGPRWPVRAIAVVFGLAVLAVLVQLLFGVV